VAYLSNARGPTDVWVKFLGGEAANLTASTRLEVTAGTGIGGLDISPDGTRVAVMARMRGSTTAFETWELPAPLPGAPHKLLDAGLQGMRWSRDSRRITYIFGGGSAGDALWVANADGTNRREIIKLHGGKHIHWPTWSADGYIYFIDTTTQLLNMEPSGISRVKPETGVVEPVVTTSRRAIFPQPMPDGSGLIYAANPASTELGLWWRARDGRIERQLTRGIGEYAEPRISADGRTLVATLYDVHDSIVRVTTIANGGAPVSMTEGYTGDLDPAIFPEDDRLVLSSSRDGNRHLWTSRLDGTDARPLTSGTSFDERPSISPDGKLIAFVSDRDGHRAVWLMNADGGAPRKLTDAAAIGGLSWSRDGRALAFAGPTDNWPGLWLVSVDDGRMRHIPTPGPDAVGEPVWCPTRDVIAYISATTSGAGLSRIAFVTPAGAPADLTLPVPPEINGFANGTLSWSPDGRRLAAVIQGAGPVSIWIVEPESSTPYHRVTEVSGGPRIRGITWTRDGSALVFGKHDVGSGDIVLMDSPQ
jgi:Tol biopolymer transport system component